VLQEYIDGDHYCTYGLVRNGELLAHSAYKPQQRWGMGSSTVFENFEDKEIEIWVRNFVAGINFTGQIAFDFIRSKEGILYPIECNPRVTSGVHLFKDSKELVELFCGKALYLTLPSMPFIRSIKLVM
jgi:predicted ATP-grasp superfamily ATP-dependent carboligase